jgi:acetyl-CoA acyltransferase 1
MLSYRAINVAVTSRKILMRNGARAASTQAKGLAAILKKNPDDVVITFAKRTAMGRAKKGQLKDTPVDELLRALFKVSHAIG